MVEHVKSLFLKFFYCVYVLNTPLCVPEAIDRLFIMPRKFINHPICFAMYVENLQAKINKEMLLGYQKRYTVYFGCLLGDQNKA